jgi:hypothetical protein
MKSLLLLGIALVVPACQTSQFNRYHDLRTADAMFEIEEADRQAAQAAKEAKRLKATEAERKGTALRESEELKGLTYRAVDFLLRHHFTGDRRVDRMLVTTVVDVNNVDATTMLGRQLKEFIHSRATQSSIDVIHPTVRDNHLLIQAAGQFLLSRDVMHLEEDYNAKTALVSTFAVAGDTVHVSMKLVSTVSNSTLAATDFVIYQSAVVRDMLGISVSR